MPLTADQRKLCDALENLADIDAELDEIRSHEDRLNLRRRNLAEKRLGLEHTLRAAYAMAGYPGIVVPVSGRIIDFDKSGVCSYRAVTPVTFALLASPTPEPEPCEEPELLVAHPLGIASSLPEFSEEES